jgi:hypothetical protein
MSALAEAAAALPVNDVERWTARFEDMLRVSREDRDYVQCRQVIDQAVAALAANSPSSSTPAAMDWLSSPSPAVDPSPAPVCRPYAAVGGRLDAGRGGGGWASEGGTALENAFEERGKTNLHCLSSPMQFASRLCLVCWRGCIVWTVDAKMLLHALLDSALLYGWRVMFRANGKGWDSAHT